MLLIYNQMSSYSLFQEKLFAFLNSLRDNLQLYFNISAVCGISGEYSHLADLIKAYEEANGQLLNLFYEPDTVLFYMKHPVDHDEIHEYVMTFLRDAEKYTEKSNKQTMEEFFDHLCKLLLKHTGILPPRPNS